MSNNRFVFTGLEELRQALRSLPDELANEAGVIVQQHAYASAQAVRDIYNQHRQSGHLADHVVVEVADHGRFGVGMAVRSKSPAAWWFDNGTQARHWGRGKSTGKMWAKTPPTHAFVSTMIRFRTAMWQELKALLVAHGLVVSGDA